MSCRVQQTPEEGWRTYLPKPCKNNNKNEDNSLKTLNDKNHQALSQKFRQLKILCLMGFFAPVSGIFIYTCHSLKKKKKKKKKKMA